MSCPASIAFTFLGTLFLLCVHGSFIDYLNIRVLRGLSGLARSVFSFIISSDSLSRACSKKTAGRLVSAPHSLFSLYALVTRL